MPQGREYAFSTLIIDPGANRLSQLSAQPVPAGVAPMRLLALRLAPDASPALRALIEKHRVDVVTAESWAQARDPALLQDVEAVFVDLPPDARSDPGLTAELELLAETLASHRLIAIVQSPDTTGVVPGGALSLVEVTADCSSDELWGRLEVAQRYRPLLRDMDGQVRTMQRLGKRLNEQFVEVDQELRLASRLQRDFLPKRLPEVGDIRFAVLYRPASWVSGDVYDVTRLDETRIGCYLADAVGHGVASGLLTMFLRQAIVGKQINGHDYTIIDPADVLATLNRELARQELPNCQFVTGCYVLVDAESHELVFARGGHPHPIHVSARGDCIETRSVGGLLGLFPDETFPSSRLVLKPGEKFIIYSDGLEELIVSRRQPEHGPVRFTPEFYEMVPLPAHACLNALRAALDRSEGSLNPRDDQTCLIIERL